MADVDAKKPRMMEWTKDHDLLLCRQILSAELYTKKKGSNERGRIWTEIAQSLRESKDVKFKPNLTQRAVRERFALLQTKFKEKEKEELQASGISPEQDELDVLIEEITEREKCLEEKMGELSKKQEMEKATAEDIRIMAMESMGQTKKRRKQEEEEETSESPKRKRRSGNEAIEFMKEKSEKEMEIREKELELQRKDQEEKSSQFEILLKQQDNLLQAIQQQQTQQQQQSQSLHVLMAQQQQQQNQAMMALLEKILSKK